jgi:hypothetical protein
MQASPQRFGRHYPQQGTLPRSIAIKRKPLMPFVKGKMLL